MGKYIGILAVVYVLYYAGNIIYDLFLKKEKNLATEEEEVFSVGDMMPIDDEQNITIDDVEEIRMPEDFEFQLTDDDENTAPDLGKLEAKFNAENGISQNPASENPSEETNEEEAWKVIFSELEEELEFEKPEEVAEIQEEETSNSHNGLMPKTKLSFKDLLNQADSQVRLVDNKEGYNVYSLA